MNPARSNHHRFIPALAAAGGRLWKLFENGQLKAQYLYNANGLRTRKTLADGAETVYHYDSQNRLIAETLTDGSPIRDYVWNGATPVAQIETRRDANGQLHNDEIIYLVSDHLNTPRAGMNPTGNITWRNDSLGFGEQAANEDPDADGNATVVNLRFPGQYFDGESGLHYNWHRYYDPETGRYITSDPIGLDGGINTFGYVGGNPVVGADLTGLAPFCPPGNRAIYGTGGGFICKPYPPRNPPRPLPYDPTYTKCDQYPEDTCEGSALNWLCNEFGDSPNDNCARKCLSDYVGERGSDPPLSYYVPQHPICWYECGWPGGWR